MALIEMKFVSQVLGVPTKLTVILSEADYDNMVGGDEDLHFEDGPGTHAWDYWDASLKKALEWFKTKKSPIYR